MQFRLWQQMQFQLPTRSLPLDFSEACTMHRKHPKRGRPRPPEANGHTTAYATLAVLPLSTCAPSVLSLGIRLAARRGKRRARPQEWPSGTKLASRGQAYPLGRLGTSDAQSSCNHAKVATETRTCSRRARATIVPHAMMIELGKGPESPQVAQ